ncbi:MAG: UDP-N-acetylmuramoyl-L-alanine--D-glutamate ligase [Coriobacteriales bacterium]|jgi:UDP-N-acetylmuramoylalanine--D-glutamate ligase|nr:UDP-N-acetylmuramoyl-L-alanine--D-glutamate ligase [Coriobacteriales bacterium]
MTAITPQTQQGGVKAEHPSLGDVCLLGLGVTGRAVLAYARRHPGLFARIDVFGASSSATASGIDLSTAACAPAPLVRFAAQGELPSRAYDLAVTSPGIPPHNDLVRQARLHASALIGEPELAWRLSPERWVCVSGTNGKTTTTMLVSHLLSEGGLRAQAVGNIGVPCIEALDRRSDGDYLVAELSSFQLESTDALAPRVAVLLNITPDHLSWHGSLAGYVAAKGKLFARLGPDGLAVIDGGGEEARAIAQALRAAGRRVLMLGTKNGPYDSLCAGGAEENIAYVDPQTRRLTVVLDKTRQVLCRDDELKVRGAHNMANALAAAAAALDLGLSATAVSSGLMSFEPLAHRLEPCGEVGGVRYVNDSKATNTDAAIKAVEAFTDAGCQRVVALFGGQDKGTSLDELVDACSRGCRMVICYGEAGGRFAEAFAACGAFVTVREHGFHEAFAAAVRHAVAGDVVLLSPACASFDEFACFEARGEAFKSHVSALKDASCPLPSHDHGAPVAMPGACA